MSVLLSDEGFRIDGRRPNEVRCVKCRIGVYTQAEGSAYLEQGNTKVLATVYGPHEVRGSKSRALHDRALINCQYSMAVFSTAERKPRPRGDRRSVEMTRHLEQTFNAAILTTLYPRSQIDIYVEVLQSDGGNYSVCINAATLALIDAGIALRDVVCACTAGDLGTVADDGTSAIVDVSHTEESSRAGGASTLTIAILPKSGHIVHVEMTGQLHEDRLSSLIDTATKGCRDIFCILDTSVREYITRLASTVDVGVI
jgi:exosome complex component RRP41